VSCCDYAAFFEDEGLMPPIHDCPAASPVPEFDDAVPLTELEHDLLRSLDFAFGIAEGKIVNLTRLPKGG
jgi:hypothetical protein